MPRRLLLLCCCWAVSGAAAMGEIALTASSVVEMVREKNPELLAARSLIAEAEGRARNTGRLANPEVEMEIAGGQDSEGRVAVGIAQRFPLTARLRLERKLSALQIESARLEVQEKERQLIAATRAAFFELAAIRDAIALAQQQSEAAKALARSLGDSAKEGLTSTLDAGEAGLTGELLNAERETLHADAAVANGRLASLLGLGANSPFTTGSALVLPKSLPANRSLEFRPDLRLAEMAVQAGVVDVTLAKASRWDDVGVGLFAEGERFRDEPEGIEPEALLGVRLSIPLPLWQNGSGKVAEKQAAQEGQQRQLEALRLFALNQALAAHRAMAARHRAAAKMETLVLPAAEKQVTETNAAYQRGEIDIQTLFRAQDRLTSIQVAAVEARKNFHIAQSEWLAAVGETSSKP